MIRVLHKIKYYSKVSIYNSYSVAVSIAAIMFCLEPKIGDLFEFVVPKVKAHWEDVAYTALRYDIPTVEAIQKKHQNDVKKCCQEMFKIWLTTAHGVQPKTWSTFIAQLKKVEELISATELIENKLKDLIL